MTTAEILQSAGYPADFVVIDFETYFAEDYSIIDLKPWPYVADPRFEIIGCGFKHNIIPGTCYANPDSQFVWAEKERPEYAEDKLEGHLRNLQATCGEDLENITVVIQNVLFDALILQEKYNIKPKYMIDLKHLDAHFDSRRSHRLKDMAKREKLPDKGETIKFIGLHLADFEGVQRQAMEEYCCRDCELEYKLFEIMLQYLSDVETELALARHTVDLYLQPRLKFDFILADELKTAMTAHITEACEAVDMTEKDIGSGVPFAAALMMALPDGESIPTKFGKRPGKKMTALLGEEGIIPALAKTDDGCKMLLAHSDSAVRSLMEARQAVKSWPLHIKRIDAMTRLATACGGWLPVPLNYYGCHTGRWSGGGGINLQNLGGSGRAGAGTHLLIQKMRNLILANEHSKLLIVDSAQIEARILAWLAGQEDMVKAFEEGRDIYSEFGTGLFSARLRKPKKTDPPPMYKLLSIRRGFAKDTVLGAGYGMGPNKFYDNCLTNPSLRPLFDSGKYDLAFVKRLIKGYRTTYSMVPKFWKSVEKCFRIVTKYPHQVMRYAPEGSKVGPGDLLTFWNDGGTVNVQLPSGRILYYPHATIRRKKSPNDYDNQLKYGHKYPLWGGSLTENIVQAIARDLLGYWILEAEKACLPVALHVHDEIIAISSDLFATQNLQILNDIMSTGPEWADGLPLAAEGDISEVYKK